MIARALVLAALLAAAAAQGPPGPTPGAGCSSLMEKKACKDSKDDCVWCEGSFSASCYSADQAKFLPPQFFKCKPKPSKKAAAVAPAVEAPAKPSCRDSKERKACLHSEALCSWCEGKFAPSMCLEEAQAKFLPGAAYTCEASKVDPDPEPEPEAEALSKEQPEQPEQDDDDEDDEDQGEQPKQPEQLTVSKKGKKDDDKKESCRDLAARKACIKSDAVCSWCEGKFAPSMCMDEAQAKFLPSMVFECEASRRSADDKALAAPAADDDDDDADDAADDDEDDDNHKGKDDKDDDKKESCRDLAARKACIKSDAMCSWCEGKFAPSMCMDEAQAKFLPSMVFECEASRAGEDKHDKKHRKHHKGDKKARDAASCRDLKERKDCVKAAAVCNWCEGAFTPAMCVDESQAQFLPSMVFSCEASRRSKKAVSSEPGLLATLTAALFGSPEAQITAPEPGPSDPCSDYTSEKKCGKDAECVWCSGQYTAGQCFSEDKAKWLPASMFKCDKPSPPEVASS